MWISVLAMAGEELVVDEAAARAPSIEWSAPAGCPSDEEVLDLTEQYFGFSLDSPTAAYFVANARVVERGTRYELELRIVAGDATIEERALEDDCRALAQLAAIKIAVALDPATWIDRAPAVSQENGEGAEPTGADPIGPLEPGELEDSSKDPAGLGRGGEPLEVPTRAGVGFGGLGVGFGWGVVPDVGAQLIAGGGYRRRSWQVRARGVVWAPTRSGPRDAQPSVRAWAVGGGFEGCLVPHLGKFEFPLCGGMEVLAMVADSTGTTSTQTRVRALPSVVLAPSLSRAWGRWSVFVRPEVGLGLWTPVFGIDASDVNYAVPRVSARFLVGMEFEPAFGARNRR